MLGGVITWPRAFFTTAASCSVPPAGTEADGAVSAIEAGAGSLVTFTRLDPDLPSLVAVIVALPVATAVTRPADETAATASLLDDQETVRPVSEVPLASATTAFA
jgi:hypothetical protein